MQIVPSGIDDVFWESYTIELTADDFRAAQDPAFIRTAIGLTAPDLLTQLGYVYGAAHNVELALPGLATAIGDVPTNADLATALLNTTYLLALARKVAIEASGNGSIKFIGTNPEAMELRNKSDNTLLGTVTLVRSSVPLNPAVSAF